MTRRVTLMTVLSMLVLVGCEEMGVPGSGSSETVVAPRSIIGQVLVIHFNGQVRSDPRCTAGSHNPRTARLWFVDESTIRGVRDDGTFDNPDGAVGVRKVELRREGRGLVG